MKNQLRNLPRFILGPWAKNTPLIEEDLERLERERERCRAKQVLWRANPQNRERHREAGARRRANPETRAHDDQRQAAYSRANHESNWLELGWGPHCSICGSVNASGRHLDTAHVHGNAGKKHDIGKLLYLPMSDKLRREAVEVVPLCIRCHRSYDHSWALFNEQSWPSLDRFAEVVREVQRENPSMTRAQLSKPLRRRMKEMKPHD